jgi:periplasmic protein TonB
MNAATFEPQSLFDLRLVLAVVIAMMLHAMVVLGVRLPTEAPVKARFEAMEVVLVPATTPLLSAVSENTAADTRAAATVAEEPPLLAAPPVERPAVKAAAVSLPKPTTVKPAPVSPVAPQPAPPLTPAAPAAEKITPTTAPPPSAPLLPTAAQLIERSMAIAATGAGLIEEKTVSGQSRAERTHHIKSNTRDFAEITYKAEVRDRIKRFGSLFQHPVPAGTATVSISIGVDGTLIDAHIVRSSHVAATDEEILRIVNLAAPFAAVWPERATISDVIHLEQPITIDQDGGFSHGQ